jgi:LAS superfamily LD-carboxypeptidase LdcB
MLFCTLERENTPIERFKRMNAVEIALVSAFVFLSVKCSEVSVSSHFPQKNKGLEVMNDSLPVRDLSRLFSDKGYLTGKIRYSDFPDFKVIAPEHTTKTNEYLRDDVYEAFLRMRTEALKEGISLTIVSGARNFERQKSIWETKWNGERKVEGKNLALEVKDPAERARLILLYSSMPGTSRHHWGTDIDINSLEDEYFLSGKGKAEYEWLSRRAAEFGFCQVYSPKGKDRPFGYEEEKWHWSYMPVASVLLRNYLVQISESDISGFAGDKTATTLKVKERYVAGINPTCK